MTPAQIYRAKELLRKREKILKKLGMINKAKTVRIAYPDAENVSSIIEHREIWIYGLELSVTPELLNLLK